MDPEFNKKIFHKKEFYENKITIKDYDINKLSEERCNFKKWKLSPNQIFLKNFMSLETPYNGLLICHGTGVGKTCSAITIAEQFKQIVKMAFNQKRKTVKNSLKSLSLEKNKKIEDLLNLRAEQLTTDDFILITKHAS